MGPASGNSGGQQMNPNGRLNPLNSSDARQFGREVGVRREAAEALRDGLRRDGVQTGELDKAIEQMKRLEGAVTGDPKGLDQLQSEVIEGLKQFEFSLFKQVGASSAKQPATGMRAQTPAEYNALVDEYFKSISTLNKKKQ
jgi:hypothetical protein